MVTKIEEKRADKLYNRGQKYVQELTSILSKLDEIDEHYSEDLMEFFTEGT